MKRLLLSTCITLLLFISINCGAGKSTPKNIILFIGDGMGVSQVTACQTVKDNLHLEKFKTMGLITTHSADAYVTESAAGATALATGYKTKNGILSIAPDSITIFKTALEYAEEAGLATGLISTSSVTHATPAAFASHVDNRGKYSEIAEQMAKSGVDVLFGGGLGFFLPQSADSSLRKDDIDLYTQLANEYQVITTVNGLDSLDDATRAVGLFYKNSPPPVKSRSFTLAELTKQAVKILSRNKKGFFLMVEGSQIDWEGHDNNSDGIIAEMIDFDEAVGVGYDYAYQDGNTLIVVTADHETGGYALKKGSIEQKQITKGQFTTGGHTGTMVPLFAFGPGAEMFGGIKDNTFVGRTIIDMIK